MARMSDLGISLASKNDLNQSTDENVFSSEGMKWRIRQYSRFLFQPFIPKPEPCRVSQS